MTCDWCRSRTEVRTVLGVLLCVFCRVRWFQTGQAR